MDELDKVVYDVIIDSGVYLLLFGFGGFLKSVLIFVNECICNGIFNLCFFQV